MAKAKKISEEDFDSWKTNVITQAVIAHLGETRTRAHEMWVSELMAQTPADPIYLAYLKVELKAKLEFLEDIENLSLRDIQEDAESKRDIGAIAREAAAQGKGNAH